MHLWEIRLRFNSYFTQYAPFLSVKMKDVFGQQENVMIQPIL